MAVSGYSWDHASRSIGSIEYHQLETENTRFKQSRISLVIYDERYKWDSVGQASIARVSVENGSSSRRFSSRTWSFERLINRVLNTRPWGYTLHRIESFTISFSVRHEKWIAPLAIEARLVDCEFVTSVQRFSGAIRCIQSRSRDWMWDKTQWDTLSLETFSDVDK